MVKFERLEFLKDSRPIKGHIFLIDDEPYMLSPINEYQLMLIGFDGSYWDDVQYKHNVTKEEVVDSVRKASEEDRLDASIEYVGLCDITVTQN